LMSRASASLHVWLSCGLLREFAEVPNCWCKVDLVSGEVRVAQSHEIGPKTPLREENSFRPAPFNNGFRGKYLFSL
jgi:hypothetical protein